MRVINNLLGDRPFSSFVRKTPCVCKYPAAKRPFFAELSDDEISQLERIVAVNVVR